MKPCCSHIVWRYYANASIPEKHFPQDYEDGKDIYRKIVNFKDTYEKE